jgi:hypothetical protein
MKDMERYVQQEDGSYICRDCSEAIMGAQVAHPIWDGPFPCSGSGRVKYETVPFCPKCESEPSFHGTPVQ